ncbi:MAG: purine-binding chemotaxis protein CheW [Desulfomonile tiedjei]|nr:purine-binding chemotaxis protein CheW [Desulfomonile tiedjei]
MTENKQLVVFSLDGQHYALNLTCVERIVRAVEVTHVPDAPETILGVINVEGEIIPVVNTRRRLGLPDREIELQDLFIIIRHNAQRLALLGDEVMPVLEIPAQQVVASDRVLPGSGYVQGVAKLDEGMVIVLTVEKMLSFDQRARLDAAIGVLEEGTHG